jgi:hypothetical protein
MKFEKQRFIQENEPKEAAENRAVDEVLLFTADCPVFRSYSWIRPSVSCGYFTPWEGGGGFAMRRARSCPPLDCRRNTPSDPFLQHIPLVDLVLRDLWTRSFDHTSYSVWPLWLLQAGGPNAFGLAGWNIFLPLDLLPLVYGARGTWAKTAGFSSMRDFAALLQSV